VQSPRVKRPAPKPDETSCFRDSSGHFVKYSTSHLTYSDGIFLNFDE